MTPKYQGRDIPILTVAPDERFDVELVEQFKTIVKEALDTSEERLQCYPRPLYGLNYSTTTLSAPETAYLRKQFELAQAMPFGCPIWPHRSMLRQSIDAGATTLTVD